MADLLQRALAYGRSNALDLLLLLLALLAWMFPDPFDADEAPAPPPIEVKIDPNDVAELLDRLDQERRDADPPAAPP